LKTEHEEQREFVSWFRQTFPGTRIFAIPNGGQRSITTAARLKVEGVCRGVPDLFIPAWGLWVEMKREKGGVLSIDQADWIEYLEGHQYTCLVTKGCGDAKQQISKFIVEHLDTECHLANN
jgi:hypothetical protein